MRFGFLAIAIACFFSFTSFASHIHDLAREGKWDAVAELLFKGANIFETDQGQTVVDIAFEQKRITEARRILRAGYAVDKSLEPIQSWPVVSSLLAMVSGSESEVESVTKFFFEFGQMLKARIAVNNLLFSAETLAYLLDTIDLNTQIDGQTPLILAIELGYLAPVVRFLERGADPYAVDGTGRTALEIANSNYKYVMLWVLVEYAARWSENHVTIDGVSKTLFAETRFGDYLKSISDKAVDSFKAKIDVIGSSLIVAVLTSFFRMARTPVEKERALVIITSVLDSRYLHTGPLGISKNQLQEHLSFATNQVLLKESSVAELRTLFSSYLDGTRHIPEEAPVPLFDPNNFHSLYESLLTLRPDAPEEEYKSNVIQFLYHHADNLNSEAGSDKATGIIEHVVLRNLPGVEDEVLRRWITTCIRIGIEHKQDQKSQVRFLRSMLRLLPTHKWPEIISFIQLHLHEARLAREGLEIRGNRFPYSRSFPLPLLGAAPTCSICWEKGTLKDTLLTFRACNKPGHSKWHKECLREGLLHSETLTCLDPNCKRKLLPAELLKLLPKEFITLTDLNEQRRAAEHHCQTPHCFGSFLPQFLAAAAAPGQNPHYRECQECGLWQCVLCEFIHTKGTCAQVAAEWKASGGGKNAPDWERVGAKLCPACHSPTEKNGGCMHMKCRCGRDYQWDGVH
jgi:hypothetical protein